MELAFAVERLLETGWTHEGEGELDHLPDGRPFPSIWAIQRIFAQAGLELTIKRHLIFNCFRAAWAPVDESPETPTEAGEHRGDVVGSCEREAAVYALAQLRTAQSARQLVAAD
jgi:hypothetical protein